MKLVVATSNPGKLREITAILHGLPLELISLADFPEIPEPEETGTTFKANARLKAHYYAEATGLPSVADDSGLEIAALDGAPGIHSARWHGTDYTVKFAKIYELLRERVHFRQGYGETSPELGEHGWAARFVCHVALADRESLLYEAEGVVVGEIAPEPRGTHGFGYDPIFYYPPFGCTLGELDLALKATISHRGKAFMALREYLRSRAT